MTFVKWHFFIGTKSRWSWNTYRRESPLAAGDKSNCKLQLQNETVVTADRQERLIHRYPLFPASLSPDLDWELMQQLIRSVSSKCLGFRQGVEKRLRPTSVPPPPLHARHTAWIVVIKKWFSLHLPFQGFNMTIAGIAFKTSEDLNSNYNWSDSKNILWWWRWWLDRRRGQPGRRSLCLSDKGSVHWLGDLDNCEFIGYSFDHKDPGHLEKRVDAADTFELLQPFCYLFVLFCWKYGKCIQKVQSIILIMSKSFCYLANSAKEPKNPVNSTLLAQCQLNFKFTLFLTQMPKQCSISVLFFCGDNS